MPLAAQAEKVAVPCVSVQWNDIQATWALYETQPSDALEKKLLDLIPVSVKEMGTCPGFQEAVAAISTHLTSLKKRVEGTSKSALCLAFRLEGISDGVFSEDLETISKTGSRKQKAFDTPAFKSACLSRRGLPDFAAYSVQPLSPAKQ